MSPNEMSWHVWALCMCVCVCVCVSHLFLSHCSSLPPSRSVLRWRDRHEWWRLAQVGIVCWQRKKVEKVDDSLGLMCFSLSVSVRHTLTQTHIWVSKHTRMETVTPTSWRVSDSDTNTHTHTRTHTHTHTVTAVWMRRRWADTNSVVPVGSR